MLVSDAVQRARQALMLSPGLLTSPSLGVKTHISQQRRRFGKAQARCAWTAGKLLRATGAPVAPLSIAVARAMINFNGLKGVLFDIDGTLTNSDYLHFKAFQELLVKVGFNQGQPITEEFFKLRISGGHNPEIAAALFPMWDDTRRALFIEEKEQYFRDLASGVLKPMPGLLEFLDWLEVQGIPKVAVTNAPGANARLMLGALKLQDRFEALILAEDCPRAKPFPDPYLAGLQLLGTRPEESLVFEDSLTGVQAGVAAGVPVIGVLSTMTPELLLGVGASLTIPDYTHLMALIKQQQ